MTCSGFTRAGTCQTSRAPHKLPFGALLHQKLGGGKVASDSASAFFSHPQLKFVQSVET
jgi:hypothetical protein